MTDHRKIIPINAKGHGPLQNGSLPECLQPAGASFAVAHLSGCLSLVRPVGMSDDEADEWLSIAAGEVAEFPSDLIEAGCKRAKRSATHHSQIVPRVVDHCEDAMKVLRNAFGPRVVPIERRLEAAPRPLTQDVIDGLNPVLRDVGLHLGYLRQDADGNLRPA